MRKLKKRPRQQTAKTLRQVKVAEMLLVGMSQEQIALELNVAPGTISKDKADILIVKEQAAREASAAIQEQWYEQGKLLFAKAWMRFEATDNPRFLAEAGRMWERIGKAMGWIAMVGRSKVKNQQINFYASQTANGTDGASDDGSAIAALRRELLHDSGLLEYRRERAAQSDPDPGAVRSDYQQRPLENGAAPPAPGSGHNGHVNGHG